MRENRTTRKTRSRRSATFRLFLLANCFSAICLSELGVPESILASPGTLLPFAAGSCGLRLGLIVAAPVAQAKPGWAPVGPARVVGQGAIDAWWWVPVATSSAPDGPAADSIRWPVGVAPTQTQVVARRLIAARRLSTGATPPVHRGIRRHKDHSTPSTSCGRCGRPADASPGGGVSGRPLETSPVACTQRAASRATFPEPWVWTLES
eukprot:scaffold1132_cov377-Prasinococcus_capsulatus_cf.AAC.3